MRRQGTKGSVFRGASPEPPKDLTHEAQRGMARDAKNKGEPCGPPSFLFEPWRGARVGSHRCPILRVRFLKYSIPDHRTEKPFDHVTVLIRRLRASESLRLPASSMCPLDLAIPARRDPDYGAAWSPAGRSKDFISVGRIAPERGRTLRSAGVHEGTGRGTVDHVEKNDRTDLAEEVVTHEQVEKDRARETTDN